MRLQKITWSFVLLCIVVLSIMASWTRNMATVIQHVRIPPHSDPTRFLYMVQTETCLPPHLRLEDTIGNTITCDCDVLVLSFSKECNETSPAHIKYIFKSGTSWNEGRNLLFELGRNRLEQYLYYIFMDDDVKLTTKLDLNPWQGFRDFLKQVEPAVGVVDDQRRLNIAYNSRKKMGCSTNENDTDYLNTPMFDSAFNAFHHLAVDHILPYTTKFDKISWWFSGYYSNVKSDIMFPGQTVMLTKITMLNPKHRPYPRSFTRNKQEWDAIMSEMEITLPEKYRNISLLLAWKEKGWKNHKISATHCFPLPKPHMPIKPFLYLNSEFDKP